MNFKAIRTPGGSVSGRLGPIGIHCDTWKSTPLHFQVSQFIPMLPNLPLTLPLGVGIA